MLINRLSRLLTHLFFPGLISFFKETFQTNNVHIAFSPLQETFNASNTSQVLLITTAIKKIYLGISFGHFSDKEQEACENYIIKAMDETEKVLSLLFKKPVAIKPAANQLPEQKRYVMLDLAVLIQDSERYMKIRVSVDFFTLFHIKTIEKSAIESIEQQTVSFLKDPRKIVPDLKSLLAFLPEIELQRLLHSLQQKKLLSIYQLYLVITAFPDLSLKLKKVLSHNTIQDILDFKRNAKKLRINRGDVRGGIYSVEEAVYFLLRETDSITYSQFLYKLQNFIKDSINTELLFSKSYTEWLEEIAGNRLLYQVAARCTDQVLAAVIGYNKNKFSPYFRSVLSARKITEIEGIIVREKHAATYTQGARAWIEMICIYRNMEINKSNPGHESFEYLLCCLSSKHDFERLLLEVGWFSLATALKNAKPKNIRMVLDAVSTAASGLISDVLKGIINPNILHDEMQVHKARAHCVAAITRLYSDGYIVLTQ